MFLFLFFLTDYIFPFTKGISAAETRDISFHSRKEKVLKTGLIENLKADTKIVLILLAIS